MMKSRCLFLFFIPLITLLSSCSQDTYSYTDGMNDERVAIESFIKQSGFIVLDEYPENGIFKENEFVRLDNGVYLHVSDPGDGIPPAYGSTVSSVAKGRVLYRGVLGYPAELGDTSQFDGFLSDDSTVKWPLVFEYKENMSYSEDYVFLGEGYVSALKYVGNGSSVSLIVPFVVGSQVQKSHLVPIYFEKVEFKGKWMAF